MTYRLWRISGNKKSNFVYLELIIRLLNDGISTSLHLNSYYKLLERVSADIGKRSGILFTQLIKSGIEISLFGKGLNCNFAITGNDILLYDKNWANS